MKKLRFYERNPVLKEAVESLLELPDDIRGVVTKGFTLIAERDFDAHLIMSDLKCLGKETVLALYKSKLKRRPYDADPYFYKAMNYLMVLSPENQWFLAKKLHELVQAMEDYLLICRKFVMAPQVAIAEEITKTYVNYGAVECKDLIAAIKTEFEQLFLNKERAQNELRRLGESSLWIESDRTGMRIRTKLDFA